MSFKLSLLPPPPLGRALGLLSWLVCVGVAPVTGVGVAAVAAGDTGNIGAAGVVLTAGEVLMAAAGVVAVAVVLSTDPELVGKGPSVVGSRLLLPTFLVGIIDGLALLSSVIRISVGLVISLMVMFQLKPAG